MITPYIHSVTSRRKRSFALPLMIGLFALSLSGCAFFVSSAAQEMTASLVFAVLNSNDPATVEAGAPAYLLMLDGVLKKNPDDEPLLRSAATIYTAYADVFVEDEDRANKMTHKALDYALRAACMHNSELCSLRSINYQNFENRISNCRRQDIPTLFTLGSSWATWIRFHRKDWNAVAEISRVEAIMERVIDLDERYQDGAAHVYLGTLASFLPPALGGHPETGRRHFERALEISGSKNLMTKVVYARQYARMVYDRNLHDRLLQEVVEADPNVPGYVLSNTLAQQKAKELLESADDYF